MFDIDNYRDLKPKLDLEHTLETTPIRITYFPNLVIGDSLKIRTMSHCNELNLYD